MGTPTVTETPSPRTPSAPAQPASANGRRRSLPVRHRWNIPWVVLGVFLVTTSALAFAVLGGDTGPTTPVLALARDVAAGEVLDEADLRVIEVDSGAAIRAVASERRAEVLGRTVIADLTRGTVVSPDLLSGSSVLREGEALVAVPLDPSAVPRGGLASGDAVMVVRTPASGETAGAGDTAQRPLVWTATVFGVEHLEVVGTPTVVISLRVDPLDGPGIAAAAAMDRVRLVLVRDLDDVPPELLFLDPTSAAEDSSDPAAAP